MNLKIKPIKLIFTRLRGTASQNDLKRLENSLNERSVLTRQNPDQETIWQEAGKTGLFDLIDSEADWEKVRSRIHIPLQRNHEGIPTRRYLLRIAAVALLAFGLSFSLYKIITSVSENEMKFISLTANNQIREVNLPDGSVVFLNAGSTLTYSNFFNTKSRDVILEGEAFFDVKSNKSLSFKVFTGESLVEVTGTCFAIREEDGTVKVSVLSGSVYLSSSGSEDKKIIIAAHQSASLLTGEELKLENKIETNLLSWKTGQLIFDEMPIDSALIDIARHFRKDLLVETDIPEEITAEFQDQPLREILDEISLVAGLKFDTTGTTLIVRR